MMILNKGTSKHKKKKCRICFECVKFIALRNSLNNVYYAMDYFKF